MSSQKDSYIFGLYMDDIYSKRGKDTDKFNEQKDCSVVATSIFLNLPYQEVWNCFEKFGRKPRKGTKNEITKKVVEFLTGKIFKEIHPEVFLDQYKKKYPTKSVTVKHLVKFPEVFGNRNMMACTRSHMLAIKGGKAIDFMHNRSFKIIWFYELV